MSGVVRIMRDMGFSAEDYPYWVRDDGCKMLGSYSYVCSQSELFPERYNGSEFPGNMSCL